MTFHWGVFELGGATFNFPPTTSHATPIKILTFFQKSWRTLKDGQCCVDCGYTSHLRKKIFGNILIPDFLRKADPPNGHPDLTRNLVTTIATPLEWLSSCVTSCFEGPSRLSTFFRYWKVGRDGKYSLMMGRQWAPFWAGQIAPKVRGGFLFLLLLLLSSPHLYLTNSVVSCHLLLGKTLWEILSRRRMSRLVFSWGKCEVINHSHKIINKSFTRNDKAK